MGKKLRFAVIGCGMISQFHVTAIEANEDAELAGVADAVYESAVSAAARYGTKAYPDLNALWADESVDAVCVCTPSGVHGAIALEAARRGRHVLIEKPMALTVPECDAIIDAARERGSLVGVVGQLRFSPQVRAVKKALEEGALGRLVSVSLSMRYYRSQAYYDSGAWRGTWQMDGGGALMNQGIHGVDLLLHLAGPVRSIFARAGTLTHRIEVEDTLSAAVEFQNGALGVIEACTSTAPGFPRRLELCGENGAIFLEEDRISRWEVPGRPMPAFEGALNYHGGADPGAIGTEGHIRQLQNFTDAIAGRAPLLIDGREGRKTVELILGAYRSARTGLAVEMEGVS